LSYSEEEIVPGAKIKCSAKSNFWPLMKEDHRTPLIWIQDSTNSK